MLQVTSYVTMLQVSVLLVLTIFSNCFALSNYGNQFYVAFLRQFFSTSRIEMIVLTKSYTPVQFYISSSTGYNYIGTTTANAATFVIIPSSLQVRESNYTYRHLGLHVTSSPSQPISVILVGYTFTPRSTYLALPCHDQPTDEYIYYGMSTDGALFSTFYSQILLVGCRDNTTVTITPTQTIQLPQDPQHSNSATVTIIAGTSYTVTLHSLQTLLIAVQYKDLSGTKIVSNYPLTVVGGHDCSLVPVNYGDCDPIATQVPPTINWGTQFLLTPLQNRTNGQRFKVIASENDTIVNVRCPQSLHFNSVSGGHVIIFDINAYSFCYIQCSHPCYIAELAFGNDYGTGYGDPLLMTVPPIRQYPHSVTFTTLPEMPTNFYSIAIPADTYFNGTVIINGVLAALNWTLIFSSNGTISGYGYTTAANGNYTISHSHPNGKIYVSVYGFVEYGGYGYPAGMLLNSLANATITNLSNVNYLSPCQYTYSYCNNTSTVTITTTIFTTAYVLTPTNTIDSSSTTCADFIITTNIITTTVSANNAGSIISCDYSTVFVPMSTFTTNSFGIVPTNVICPSNGDVISVTVTETTPVITNCICDTGSSFNYFTTDSTAVDFTHTVTTTLTNNVTINNNYNDLTSSCDQTTVFVPIVTTVDCLEKTDISPTTTIPRIESQIATTSNTITAISAQKLDVTSSYDTHSTNKASIPLTTMTASYPDKTPLRTDDISMDSSKPTIDHILMTTLVITASCTSTNFDTTTFSDKTVRPSNNVIGTSSKVTDTTSALGGSMALIIIIIIAICIVVAIVSYKVGVKRGKSQDSFQNTDVSMVEMNHSNVMAFHNSLPEHNDSEYEDMAPPEQVVQFTEPNISSLMVESLNTESLPAYKNIDSLYEDTASPEQVVQFTEPNISSLMVESFNTESLPACENIDSLYEDMASLQQVQFTETEMLSSMGNNSGDHIAPTYHVSTAINTNDSNFTPYSNLSLHTIKEPSIYDTISHPLPPLPTSEIIGVPSN